MSLKTDVLRSSGNSAIFRLFFDVFVDETLLATGVESTLSILLFDNNEIDCNSNKHFDD